MYLCRKTKYNTMLQEKDLKQLAAKGISEQQMEKQLKQFETGFPFLRLEAAAAVGKGIIALTASEQKDYVKAWEDYKAEGKEIVKFVPASGAASRMFKDMFAFHGGYRQVFADPLYSVGSRNRRRNT